MDMTNVEKVIKAIEKKGFTITKCPCKASIQKEDEEQSFLGNYIEFEGETPFGGKWYKLFIADEPDGYNFHNGCSVLGNGYRIPDVLWFKEVYDKITIFERFYI